MIATPDTHEPWPEADDPEAAALREAGRVRWPKLTFLVQQLQKERTSTTIDGRGA
jgi:hypothetical protein